MKEKNFAESMSIISLVFKIIGALLGLIAVFLLIWKVFGHSPTSESVIVSLISVLTALVSAIIALLFNMMYKFGKMESDISYIKRMMFALIKDVKEFKSRA